MSKEKEWSATQLVQLSYSVHACSSYSAGYRPENILEHDPTDQKSRWFSDGSTATQFVVLKLEAPAIVKKLTFGKYIKHHVSDLKKFRIEGGLEESNLSTVLSAGLKNDGNSETFDLRCKTSEGLDMPILYIKVIPLQSWGPSYNYTIWYIDLHGLTDPDLVRSALYTVSLCKEEQAVRLLLKHLRSRCYITAYEALSRETGVMLEGHTQTKLWRALVEEGNYDLAEQIIDRAATDDEFEWYLSWQPYKPTWIQISELECRCCPTPTEDSNEQVCPVVETNGATGEDAAVPQSPATATNNTDIGCSDRDWTNRPVPNATDGDSSDFISYGQCDCTSRPGPRGGHQLVCDSVHGKLYLFGGWDGEVDLDDLWMYSISADKWTLLCRHSAEVGGPSPRSCHKMVVDHTHQCIYTLGRYLDTALRTPENMKSDLYVYDILRREWQLICSDTATVGGPSLVFDHQMCVDSVNQTLYVFGGRLLPTNDQAFLIRDETAHYSGMYAYYIATNTWQHLLPDDSGKDMPCSRVGHSMLFHPKHRRLYIFAGQRNREHLLDMWWYDVDTRVCGAFAELPNPPRPPSAPNFTQRATLDPDTDEIFVLSGLNKEKDKRVCNTLWVFSIRRGTWTCAYRNERVSSADPQPRFAHQLVYDSAEKVHYLFGGNPGNSWRPKTRLNDLWALRLQRPLYTDVLKSMKSTMREARYRELVKKAATAPSIEPAVAAVNYLRDRVHHTIDHNDPEQVEHFKKLPTAIFAGMGPPQSVMPSLTPALTRVLTQRKSQAEYFCLSGSELSRALATVLGCEDVPPEQPTPFDDMLLKDRPVDITRVSQEPDDNDPVIEVRASRVKLYNELCKYFRPSKVPPRSDVTDLVKL